MSVLARPAATCPALIPASAAGRDHVFFFGTLMHVVVLETVLDRPVEHHETMPARLCGYRRERAASASYPVLVDDPRGVVEGRLLQRPSVRDIRRINHFEADEYRAVRLDVDAGRHRHQAWVFVALDDVEAMRPSGEPWDLERWAAAHLGAYRRAIEHWMADAPGHY
jgi:hypothetical protein